MKIRTTLLLLILSVTTLVSFSASISGYRESMASAERIFDDNLVTFARALAAATRHTDGPLPAIGGSGIALQIWHHDQLVVRSDNALDVAIRDQIAGFADSNFLGQRWRSYALLDSGFQDEDFQDRGVQEYCFKEKRVDENLLKNNCPNRRIIVAQPMAHRQALAEQMALASLSPLIIATPVLALLITVLITHGLSPLKKLSATLRHKQADDFLPLDMQDCPAELQPVIDTINHLLTRVATAFEREKSFSSDAAHELRTPLSVLQVGIHNLSEQHPKIQNELVGLQQGVERMSYVVEQILLLNRTNPDHFHAKFEALCLQTLCQQVISDRYEEIATKAQTIELEARPVMVNGDSFTLSTLLHNLIGNASKYTPELGEIRVTLTPKGSQAVLTVEDSGPGIPIAERPRVINRFYRVGGDQRSHAIAGCGLGMAIVKQAVDLHHGTIELTDSSALGGLRVIVCLPLADAGTV